MSSSASHEQSVALIPAPVRLERFPDADLTLNVDTPVLVHADAHGSEDVAALARTLESDLRSIGSDVMPSGRVRARIAMLLQKPHELGPEGYSLVIDSSEIRLGAEAAAGLCRGVQTLRQLFRLSVRAGPVEPLALPQLRIDDGPRFTWRGAMLDVARHFMPVDAVKRYIDLIALYKMNVLHLHLSDDQGWRVYIDSWPRLAEHGGSLQVGSSGGGYYTKADLAEIVRHAAANHMTVVPEIDTPGHTNAALSSYGELTCSGEAPSLYTGTKVGFSSLCIDSDVTYRFLDDVVGEICDLVPGNYFHIGGDEALMTTRDEYAEFIKRACSIVRAHRRTPVGWHEVARADTGSAIAQYWGNDTRPDARHLARRGVQKGMKLVMSPSDRAYLDMKYDASTPLGLDWAGFVDVHDSYSWDPATLIDGLDETDVLGVESALWTETIPDVRAAEFMTFPRLAAIAEIGWSEKRRSWDEFRTRLAFHGPVWEAMQVNFHRSPQIQWMKGARLTQDG
jgi:hexosaminidase